jgi:L-asparaginase
MFRAWIEEDGSKKCLIFREDNWESGPEGWDDVKRCQ